LSINLSEITRDLVLNQIKTTIAASLAEIRSDRDDAVVSTEPPKSYFIYAPAASYRCPAIFVVVDRMDFKQFDAGANFVPATVTMYVSVLVEDKDETLLTIKADRYYTAIHQSINQKNITSADDLVKISIKVMSAQFGEFWKFKGDSPQGMFRKEVRLTLNVEHYESL